MAFVHVHIHTSEREVKSLLQFGFVNLKKNLYLANTSADLKMMQIYVYL